MQRYYETFLVVGDMAESGAIAILLSKLEDNVMEGLLKEFEVEQLTFENIRVFMKSKNIQRFGTQQGKLWEKSSEGCWGVWRWI